MLPLRHAGESGLIASRDIQVNACGVQPDERGMVRGGRLMRFSSRIIVFCLLGVAAQAFAGNQIYRYKDDSGTLNFTTELYSIPEKYRSEAVAMVPETPAPVRKDPVLRVVSATGEYRMSDHDTRMD